MQEAFRAPTRELTRENGRTHSTKHPGHVLCTARLSRRVPKFGEATYLESNIKFLPCFGPEICSFLIHAIIRVRK